MKTQLAEFLDKVSVYWFTKSKSDWFAGGRALDAEIKRRFGDSWRRFVAPLSQQSAWKRLINVCRESETPLRTVGAIVALDQFPRHIYRGADPKITFALDPLALRLARFCMAHWGAVRLARQNLHHLLFAAMPFQHAEDNEVQCEGVAILNEVKSSIRDSPPLLQEMIRHQRSHARVIRYWGYFPKRIPPQQRNEKERRYAARHPDRPY